MIAFLYLQHRIFAAPLYLYSSWTVCRRYVLRKNFYFRKGVKSTGIFLPGWFFLSNIFHAVLTIVYFCKNVNPFLKRYSFVELAESCTWCTEMILPERREIWKMVGDGPCLVWMPEQPVRMCFRISRDSALHLTIVAVFHMPVGEKLRWDATMDDRMR